MKYRKISSIFPYYKEIWLGILFVSQSFKIESDFSHFASRFPWFPRSGSPRLVAKADDDPSKNSANANILVVVSDQDLVIGQARQAMRWSGIRTVSFPDFNHRDSNDAALVPPIFRVIIEVLGKCATGPFGQGYWRKSVTEAANLLLRDDNCLARYFFFSYNDASYFHLVLLGL